MERKLISFSLWGTDEKYTYGAIENTYLASFLYPGWKLRFYVDKNVPSNVIDKLKENKAEIIVNDGGGWEGSFWRFYPVDDPDIDIVIIRDTDSRIDNKEVAAVNAWLKSGKSFHTMHDNRREHYNVPILGGMWGYRKKDGFSLNIKERIEKWKNNRNNKYYEDQYFLKSVIWPIAKNDVMVHGVRERSFPKHLPNQYVNHIGERCGEIATVPANRTIDNDKICYIIGTTHSKHKKQVNVILSTWGKSVPVYFITDKVCNVRDGIFIKALNTSVKNGGEQIQTCAILQAPDVEQEWFFFGNENTFVNTITLSKYVKGLNVNDLKIYGYENKGTFKKDSTLNYASYAAGFLLSKKTFQILKKDMENKLMFGTGYGDVTIGKHVKKCGIKVVHNNLFNIVSPSNLSYDKSQITFSSSNERENRLMHSFISGESSKKALFVSHLNLNDNLMCIGAVDYLASIYDEVRVLVKPINTKTVKYLYEYLDNVIVTKTFQDNPSYDDCKKIISDYENKGFVILKSGKHTSGFREGLNIPDVWYRQINIDISERNRAIGKIKRDLPAEAEFLNTRYKNYVDKKYVFVHDSTGQLDMSKIRKDLPIIKVDNLDGEDIFMHLLLTEGAEEIHCSDDYFASILDLIDLSNVKRKCLHRYTYPKHWHNYPTYIQTWEIIYEDDKFNRLSS